MPKNGLDVNYHEHIMITSEDLEKILESMENRQRSEDSLNEKKMLSTLWKVVAALIVLGTLVWGAASLSFSKIDEDKADVIHKEHRDRIIQIEKNDIEQTTILKEIKKSVDKLAQ